ncbi:MULTISPECIES: flagellin [Rubrivivax]|uniref:Flagellin n=1 Tax=Rubrivivax benzoatilyticus TaxID=316997 RepID=A0ABX0I258_9BURK|nr:MULTISPECIES: flagellin [Rubrivivax]MCD0418438.1 flagellin FliC [Rubrivivax sp. JA1024]EGJ11383.1 flagellin domain-containing protein [Rubrivivax benzoatilyticus JA2 = ATCC BAA-35]MCC9596188.1 flagellin FliC [Rubrivivax sp. JA1055]MCC9647471.1 flagellin FliC [Rubrivivax sp. JA1029]NHK99911.1 flagellin FliC [Rubrivivax benzoatilyticus]
MPATINTNIASLNAQRNLTTSQSSLATSMARLSSGLRVNSAKDDAAGLAIAERMNAQIKGMNVAVRNANDGISWAQTAEGALAKVGDSLQRMRELAVQSRNATNTAKDQDSLQKEFLELQNEVKRVLGGTTFNEQKIFGQTSDLTFQVGANTSGDDVVTVKQAAAFSANADIGAVTSTAAIIGTSGSVTSAADLKTVIDNIDKAINTVNNERSMWGATQNRFEAVISNLQVSIENQSAARSRIMDADFASETANMSRAQILQQAGNAMVAQANQLPQQVLSLLR